MVFGLLKQYVPWNLQHPPLRKLIRGTNVSPEYSVNQESKLQKSKLVICLVHLLILQGENLDISSWCLLIIHREPWSHQRHREETRKVGSPLESNHSTQLVEPRGGSPVYYCVWWVHSQEGGQVVSSQSLRKSAGFSPLPSVKNLTSVMASMSVLSPP